MKLTRGLLVALFLYLPLQQAPAQSGSATMGQWTSVQTWPYIAGHMHMLPTGKVLFWPTYNNGYYPQIWDPTANSVTAAVQTGYDLFCTGHSFLANGQLLVTGGDNGSGYGIRTTSIYDPPSGTWTRRVDMNAGRWYPTNTTLANGDVLVVAGVTETGSMNTLPEVWQSATGTYRDLTNAQLSQPLYPRMFLAPNGQVAYVAPVAVSQYLDTSGTGKWSTLATEKYGSSRDYGNAVIYDAGKILLNGGGDPPTATAEVIDLNAATPAWRYVASMSYPRRQSNATLLPDGRVLVTGGSSGSGFDDYTHPVYPAEIWDPATELWTTVASISVYRGYHSTAVLLPDGRVVSGGGEVGGASYEVYSPPYLFKGARPTITSAPTNVGYGQVFFVQTPDAASISQVTWIRLSSVTHAFNQNQRLLHLSFSQTTGGLNVTSPANANLSPPGDYMLFIVNFNGVPSVATFINNDTASSAPTLSSVTVSPTTVTGGSSATGTVTLSGPAPSGGATVTLSSSVPGVATVPTNVMVGAGTTSATFPVTTSAVSSATVVTISASYNGGSTQTATLTVNPVVVSPPSITLVQKAMTPGQYSGAASTAAQFSSATTAHTLLVALVYWNNASATVSVADTLGNTWKSTPAYQNSASDIQIFYVENNVGGADTVTATQSAGTNPIGLYLAEYSGLANSNTLDTQAGQAAPSTTQSMTTPSITTNQQDLLIAFFNDVLGSGTITPGTGWSSQGTATSFYTMWEDEGEGTGTPPGTYQGAATNPLNHRSWVGMIAAFRPSLTGNPTTLASVTVSPTTVTGGSSATGTVTLSGPAPSGGATVTLSSSVPGVATVPTNVMVGAGTTSATFPVTTSAVSSATVVTISASYNGGSTQTATLTVNPVSVTLMSVGVSPTSVTGGGNATGTVTLSGAAPNGGATVALSSSAPGVATVPTNVMVGAGTMSATFPVTTSAVSSATVVTISASYNGGSTQTATLTVNPVVVSPPSITLVQKAMTPGQYSGAASTAAQFSSATTAHTLLVALVYWNNASATVSVADTLGNTWKSTPAYQNSASDIQIFYVENNVGGADTVTATQSAGTNPIGLYLAEYSGLANSNTLDTQAGQAAPSTTQSMTTPSITTNQQDLLIAFFNDVLGSGTITPGTGWSSQGTATSFYTMWEDEGEGTGTPPGTYQGAATNPLNHRSWVGMIAAFRPSLTGNPTTLASVTVSPTTVTGGSSATGTVTLSGPAPSGGATVTLSSSVPGVATVPTNVMVGAGTTSATFPVTTSAVSSATVVTISASYNGGSTQTATLTVNPVVVSPPSITLVQKAMTPGQYSGAASTAAQFSSATTAHTLLVALVYWNNASATVSVADTLGNTWKSTPAYQNSASDIQIFYVENNVGGADTVTATQSAGTNPIGLYLAEYSGLANSNTLDTQAGQAAPSTTQSMTTPSITTNQQDLLIAFFNDVLGSGTITPGTGWSSQGTATSFYTMWEDEGEGTGTPPGTYQGAATNPLNHRSWVGMIAAFRPGP